jgi:hypothetical protein
VLCFGLLKAVTSFSFGQSNRLLVMAQDVYLAIISDVFVINLL